MPLLLASAFNHHPACRPPVPLRSRVQVPPIMHEPDATARFALPVLAIFSECRPSATESGINPRSPILPVNEMIDATVAPGGAAGFRHREDGGLGETGPTASAAVSGSRHRFGAEPKVKGAKNLEHRVQRGIAIARKRLVETFP